LAGNSTYFFAISLFRSRLLSKGTKIQLYKTLIRPVVSCGAETWTMMKNEQALLIFERKIYRRKYGPKYENGPLNDISTLTKDWSIWVRRLEYLKDPKCYAGGSVATGRVTHARQDEGERRD